MRQETLDLFRFYSSTAGVTNLVMVFGSAVLVSYNLRKADFYQDYVLLLGILGGAVFYIYIAVYGGSVLRFKDFMPAVISLSLVLSVCIHKAVR